MTPTLIMEELVFYYSENTKGRQIRNSAPFYGLGSLHLTASSNFKLIKQHFL